VIIGRSASDEIVVCDPTVSRHHAELSRRAGRLRVRDLGSLNGTTVNGRPVEVASLRRGDVLTLGALAIRVAG
jgi:pSer/pThr/pTyr-binding forkhead associated (FHA) protein